MFRKEKVVKLLLETGADLNADCVAASEDIECNGATMHAWDIPDPTSSHTSTKETKVRKIVIKAAKIYYFTE